jgi:hypothetical protein
LTFGGLDTQMANHRQVQALRARAANDDAHVGLVVDYPQQRHVAKLRVRVAVHLAGEYELAVAKRLHFEAGTIGIDSRKSHFAAELCLELRTHAGVVRHVGNLGIVQYSYHRLPGAVADQRLEQAGGIGSAAGTRIVLRVGEHHRPVRIIAHRAQHRFVRREGFEAKVRLIVEHLLVKRVGGRFDRIGVHAIGNHRGAAFGDVRRRKPGRKIDVTHSGAQADAVERRIDRLAGFEIGALRGQRKQERNLAHRLVQRIAGKQRLE